MRPPDSLLRPTLALALACAAFLCIVPRALAGTYDVTSCWGSENNSWAPWVPSAPYATAYAACPGGTFDPANPFAGAGLLARNVGSATVRAPAFSAAAMQLAAPAGAVISGADFDAQMTMTRGWQAGLYDAAAGRWLWCGPGCLSTFGNWVRATPRFSSSRIQALVVCGASACPQDGWRGFIGLRRVVVHVSDDSPPVIGGSGSLWTADGWLRGSASVAFSARDNVGVRRGVVQLDGGPFVLDQTLGCDYTRVVPCGDGDFGATVDTHGWADGSHTLRIAGMDTAGNWAAADHTFRVDNHAPEEITPTLDVGSGWTPTARPTVRWDSPGGQAAPIAQLHVRVCAATCREWSTGVTTTQASWQLPAGTAFAGPGEYAVRAWLEDAAGNGAAASDAHIGPAAAWRFDDTAPGRVALDETGWIGAAAARDFVLRGRVAASEHVGPSGIAGFSVRVGAEDAVTTSGATLEHRLGALPDGRTTVRVRAVSGAGVESASETVATLRVDRTAPSVTLAGAPDAGDWQREPVQLRLAATDRGSGVATLAYRLDGGTEQRLLAATRAAATARAASTTRAAATTHAASTARAATTAGEGPRAGAASAPVASTARAATRAGDGPLAGAASAPVASTARAATTAGYGSTAATATVTVADDGRHSITVRALDAAGNASDEQLAAFRVDRTPPDTVAFEAPDPADPAAVRVAVSDRTSGVAGGVVEARRAGEDWRALPTSFAGGRLTARISAAGAYELRARVSDAAGNEAVGAHRTDGSPARVTIAPRDTTRLQITARGADRTPAGNLSLALRRGALGPVVHATLRASSDARLPGQAVQVLVRTRGKRIWRPVSSLRTDRRGTIAFRIGTGPSRTIRLRFAGTPALRPASATVTVQVRASRPRRRSGAA